MRCSPIGSLSSAHEHVHTYQMRGRREKRLIELTLNGTTLPLRVQWIAICLIWVK